VIRDQDHVILAQLGVTALDTSNWWPWPALDFTYDSLDYTIIYGLDTDVFVLVHRPTESLWSYKYKANYETMKVAAYVPADDQGRSIPLDRYTLCYLAAIIMHDVRKIAPLRARATAAGYN
jgi:hypothetical protein